MNYFGMCVIISMILSCNNSNRTDVTGISNEIGELSKKQINIIPEILTTDQQDLFKKSKWKIITFINGGCSACLDKIEKWYDIEQEMKKYKDVTMFFYVGVEDIAIIQPWLRKFPLKNIIIDKKSMFLNTNKLNVYDNNLLTFLFDSNNKIKIIGSPIHYTKILQLYRDIIEGKRQYNGISYCQNK